MVFCPSGSKLHRRCARVRRARRVQSAGGNGAGRPCGARLDDVRPRVPVRNHAQLSRLPLRRQLVQSLGAEQCLGALSVSTPVGRARGPCAKIAADCVGTPTCFNCSPASSLTAQP
jgi:hypothetical protein